MNKHLARNIIEATADKERLNDWDKDQLRWVARSLDSLEETEYVSTDHNPDPYTPPNHKWVIDYAGRKETCSVCGAIEPLSTKLSYRVNIGGRDFFVSGYDVDDAIGMAVAMARIEGLTEPIKAVEAEKLDIDIGQPFAASTDDYYDTTTVVMVPVEFQVHVRDREVVKFVVMPQESNAGYFGPPSQIWDGPDKTLLDEPGDGSQSPFWDAVSTALMKAGVDNPIPVYWEE